MDLIFFKGSNTSVFIKMTSLGNAPLKLPLAQGLRLW